MHEPPEVNPDLVRALLAKESVPGGDTVKTGHITVDEHTNEELKAALNTGSEQPTDQRVETPLPNQAFNPDNKGVPEVFQFLMNSNVFGEIKVSDTEKNIFWKAMLNDTACIFDIEIPGQTPVIVKVRNLTAFDQQVVASCLAMDEKDGTIKGLESMATMMQGYSLLLQVDSIDNTPFPRYTCDPKRTLLEVATEVCQKMRATIWPMNSPRLVMLTKAVAIYEYKCKLCNDGLVNRDFWSPPSSA